FMASRSSGLHSVDATAALTDRLRFLDDESAKPAMRWARERSFERLELTPGARILDVGCGTGDAARAIARLISPGGRVVGVDVEPMMIAEATRRSKGADLPVEFGVGDVYALEHADEAFDGCRAERVLLHVAEPG